MCSKPPKICHRHSFVLFSNSIYLSIADRSFRIIWCDIQLNIGGIGGAGKNLETVMSTEQTVKFTYSNEAGLPLWGEKQHSSSFPAKYCPRAITSIEWLGKPMTEPWIFFVLDESSRSTGLKIVHVPLWFHVNFLCFSKEIAFLVSGFVLFLFCVLFTCALKFSNVASLCVC